MIISQRFSIYLGRVVVYLIEVLNVEHILDWIVTEQALTFVQRLLKGVEDVALLWKHH